MSTRSKNLQQMSPKSVGQRPIQEDGMQVLLAEYQALRQEVSNRQTLSYAIIAADLTALGAAEPVAGHQPGILLGVAGISTLLWMFWLAQTAQVHRIASYVALRLRPALVKKYRCDLMGWEAYVRRLTSTRESAVGALTGEAARTDCGYLSRKRDGVYISLLLGGGTPLFLGIFSAVDLHINSVPVIAAATCGGLLVVALWIYALTQAIAVLRTDMTIARQIIKCDEDLNWWLRANPAHVKATVPTK